MLAILVVNQSITGRPPLQEPGQATFGPICDRASPDIIIPGLRAVIGLRRGRVTPMADPLRVVILKPSKYTADGYVERFRWGFMPNSSVPFVRSMTPERVGNTPVEVHAIDE